MTETITLFAFGAAALTMAMVSGVFLGFSDFIMRSLSAATPQAGIEAMQQINRKVLSSVFVVWLLGLAPVSVGLAVHAWLFMDGPARGWFIAGCAIYVVGCFLVTVLGNVPMNRRLDTMAVDGADTAVYWTTYGTWWTLWNHVRTVASGLAAAALLVGCVLYV